jgi:hypothetical protein
MTIHIMATHWESFHRSPIFAQRLVGNGGTLIGVHFDYLSMQQRPFALNHVRKGEQELSLYLRQNKRRA